MFVVTMSQRSKEPTAERFNFLHKNLEQRLKIDLGSAEATESHAFQRVFTSSEQVVEAALFAMRLNSWNVGIGIGIATTREAGVLEGPGLKASNLAVALASKQGQLVPLRIEAAKPPRGVEPTQLGHHAQSVLQLLGHVVSRRSEAEWAVLDLLEPGVRGQQRRVADELGMTVQAVSQAVKRSLFNSEYDVRDAVRLLLDQADAAVNIQAHSAL